MTQMLTPRSDQRRTRRYEVPMALALESRERKDRIGIALDVSIEGARFNTASGFAEGDLVSVTLIHESAPELAKCKGRVVRVERADVQSTLLWRFVTTVRFERPLREIESTLRQSASLA